MATSIPETRRQRRIPEGLAAVPLSAEAPSGNLRICVLIDASSAKDGAQLIPVREMTFGRAFLGCVLDAGERVVEWIEIWVQESGASAGSPGGARSFLSNAVADALWQEEFEAARSLEPAMVFETGWEREHPPAMAIDPAARRMITLGDGRSARPLRLCTDEQALAEAGLPAWGSSLHRYLYSGAPDSADGDRPLIPVNDDAPRNERTVEISKVTGDAGCRVPFNIGCGLLQVRRFVPVGLDDFSDVLSGGTWPGVSHGKRLLELGDPTDELVSSREFRHLSDGQIVLARRGMASGLLESFYLKLCAMTDAVGAIEAHVRATGRPLLNVTSDSFGVDFAEAGSGVPLLWTGRTHLVRPGEAVPLDIQGTDLTYFMPGRRDGASIYRPDSWKAPLRGTAAVRLRAVTPESDGSVVVEGTIGTDEALHTSARDLIWFRIALPRNAADLYVRVDPKKTSAPGEIGFRSVPHRFDEAIVAQMREREGVRVDRTPFEVVPLLATPCDLYSLAVVAVRVFLCRSAGELAVALDELMKFGVRVERDDATGETRSQRMLNIYRSDDRWAEHLGPQRLTRGDLSHESALSVVPRQLWMDLLALITRMFPGGSDRLCGDLGDAPPGGLHRVFSPVLEELRRLLIRARSLVVVDWTSNREIHAVIRRSAVSAGGVGV